MRRIPKFPDISVPTESLLKPLEYTISLVTPMFGGGVTAGEVDSSMPVRATAIRGHLRFWWRAIYGPSFKSVAEMKEREEEIWGSTEQKSRVRISVELLDKTLDYRWHYNSYDFDKYGPEAYVLFPAKNNKVHILKEGLKFKLTVFLSSEMKEENTLQVKETIKAWLYFGGLGARTRRGCGSLDLTSSTVDVGEYKKIPGSKLFIDKTDKTPEDKNTPNKNPILDAWNQVVEIYRRYRQPRGPLHVKKKLVRGEMRTVKVPGRSLWPEPDSIRYLTGCSLKEHENPIVDACFIPSFPRAALGLPINIQFIVEDTDKDNPPIEKDPSPCYVLPIVDGKARERMASPVITKPIKIGDKWYPMVMVLDNGYKGLQVTVKGQKVIVGEGKAAVRGQKHEIVPLDVTNVEGFVCDGKLKKLDPMKGSDNAVDGFVNYIKKKSFQEVAL